MLVWRETGWNGPVTGWCDRLDGGVRRLQHGGIGFRVVRDRSLNRIHPQQDLRLDRLYVVYPGLQRYRLGDGVECVPLDQVRELVA